MHKRLIDEICIRVFRDKPESVVRNLTGIGSHVYTLRVAGERYVIKIFPTRQLAEGSLYWLRRLQDSALPLPRILAFDLDTAPPYCLMTFIEGNDLGHVYANLTEGEKKDIARSLAGYQSIAGNLPRACGYGFLSSYDDEANMKPSWAQVVEAHIARSETRMAENGIFPASFADRVRKFLPLFSDYFASVEPRAFLDDTTTKNLMIHEGRISGIIDLDWVCFGDSLYVTALTEMALRSMGADLLYVGYWKECLALDAERERVLRFYVLVFCLDFMSEKGMRFNRDTVEPVSEGEVQRFTSLFSELESGIA